MEKAGREKTKSFIYIDKKNISLFPTGMSNIVENSLLHTNILNKQGRDHSNSPGKSQQLNISTATL